MRRFFAILLLVVLPLQFSWAAVAAYCVHEEPRGSQQRVGHHEQSQDGAADLELGASDLAKKSPSTGELDCGHCHGNCASMLPAIDVVTADLSTDHPRPTIDETAGAHAPARPERPQWLPLA